LPSAGLRIMSVEVCEELILREVLKAGGVVRSLVEIARNVVMAVDVSVVALV